MLLILELGGVSQWLLIQVITALIIAENKFVVAEFYLEVFFPEKSHPEYDEDQDKNSKDNGKRGVTPVNRNINY